MDILDPKHIEFYQNAILVLAAGLIGFAAGQIANALQRRHEIKQKAIDERRSYRAWLTGLEAELRHIQAVIKEITRIVNRDVSTKRINSDFLQEARLVIFKYDEDTDFLEQLTTAFRNIVHTNGMLDRLEVQPVSSRHGIRPNVISSMEGVGVSVNNLAASTAQKLGVLQEES